MKRRASSVGLDEQATRQRVPASPLTRNSPGLRVNALDGRLRAHSSPICAAYLLPGDPQTRTGCDGARRAGQHVRRVACSPTRWQS